MKLNRLTRIPGKLVRVLEHGGSMFALTHDASGPFSLEPKRYAVSKIAGDGAPQLCSLLYDCSQRQATRIFLSRVALERSSSERRAA
jgi:hypothetical protein